MVHGEPDAQQALRAELKKLNITVNLLIDRRLPASLYAYLWHTLRVSARI